MLGKRCKLRAFNNSVIRKLNPNRDAVMSSPNDVYVAVKGGRKSINSVGDKNKERV